MRHSITSILTPALLGAAAAFGVAVSSAPAQTVEELTVYGRAGPDGEARALSQPVSYADLDLRYQDARDELRRRVDFTARDLCDRLGETGDTDPIAPSCRAAAVKDGMIQARFAIDQAVYGAPYAANSYSYSYSDDADWAPRPVSIPYDDDE